MGKMRKSEGESGKVEEKGEREREWKSGRERREERECAFEQ